MGRHMGDRAKIHVPLLEPVSVQTAETLVGYTMRWVFPKIGVPQNGWFIMENPIKHGMIWGYPYFWKHADSYGYLLHSIAI